MQHDMLQALSSAAVLNVGSAPQEARQTIQHINQALESAGMRPMENGVSFAVPKLVHSSVDAYQGRAQDEMKHEGVKSANGGAKPH